MKKICKFSFALLLSFAVLCFGGLIKNTNTKASAARKFITKGDKVKVTLRFRGREMAHMQSSKVILDEFAEKLADVAIVEKAPKVEGRSMTMFLAEKR